MGAVDVWIHFLHDHPLDEVGHGCGIRGRYLLGSPRSPWTCIRCVVSSSKPWEALEGWQLGIPTLPLLEKLEPV